MKTLPFHKMHAQGNDFVILDGRRQELPELDAGLIGYITDRRLGIGCDQLLVLLPDPGCDGAMRIFNHDTSEAGNCGNGLRCAAALLFEESGADSVNIRLADRTVRAEKTDEGIRVHMGKAAITGYTETHVDIDIGNPHRVYFEAIEDFPQDRNIEIVSGQVADDVYVEIIERGVGQTPSCGSGACATAVAIWQQDGHQRPQHIHMPGGKVTVSGSADDLLLEGPVSFVFTGKIRL